MRLFHGSTCEVRHPNVAFSREHLDFGKGFYATSYVEQAERWALRKARFEQGPAIVNEYEVDWDPCNHRVLRFDDPDEQWVRFVCDCRAGGTQFADYDLIIGGVADDKVFYAVDMFLKGIWDMETTLSALRFYNVNDQWCFVSQCAADTLLTFARSWEVPQQ